VSRRDGSSPEPSGAPCGPRGFLGWFVRDPRTGRVALAQWPNPALGVWAVTVVVSWLDLVPGRAAEIRWIGAGALIAWSADELIRGTSPARRLLGLIVLGWQVYGLVG
jgi:hypothetical protein